MGRLGKVGRFIKDFGEGFNATHRIAKDFAMGSAANASPEESTAYTPDQAQQIDAAASAMDQSGNPLYKVEATDDGNYRVTPTAGGETGTLAPTKHYSMGGKTQTEAFSEDQIGAHRLKAQSDMALRFGDVTDAARYDALAERRRHAADDQRVRDILSDPSGKPHVTPFVNDGTAEAPKSVQGSGSQSAMPGLERQKSYLETVGPRVTDEYLRQGKITEARAWRDFSESESGHAYANDFATAQRKITAGDYEGAIPTLNKMYAAYPDGQRAQTEHIGDGKYRITMIDEATGKPRGVREMSGADFGKQALNALSPIKLVEFTVQQQAKREAESASLNKSIELEGLRQKGQDVRDDRRDERLNRQIGAMDGRLSRQLESREKSGGLTTAQQRSNFEIEAARGAVADLSPQDIMRRTAKTSNTGRENPDYDPGLARQAALANRRMLGADDWFDQRQGRKPGGDSFAGKPVAEMTDAQLQQFGRAAGADGKAKIDAEQARRTLAGIPEMQGHQIGKYVEGKGYQVLDAQGRPVSYLRRKQ